MYCLYTSCSTERVRYAAFVRRARERRSSRSAIRIDRFTSRRNSPRSHRRGAGTSLRGNERLRTRRAAGIRLLLVSAGMNVPLGKVKVRRVEELPEKAPNLL